MSGLDQFIGKKGGSTKGASSRSQRFNKLKKKKKTKEGVRQLEQKLLVPETLPTYIGKKADPVDGMNKRAVKVFFKTNEDFKLFSEAFTVTGYIENSCYKIESLMVFLRAMKEGTLTYDEETKRLTCTEPRNNKRKHEVGRRKRRRTKH